MSQINEVLDPPVQDPEILEEFDKNHQELVQIQEQLDILINQIELNPSFFSKASLFWKKRPLWQKILIGVPLVLLTLIVGAACHLSALLCFSLFFLVVYALSWFLMDNHQSQNEHNKEELKKGMTHLVGLLGGVISALNVLHQNLAQELETFHNENLRLDKSLEQLKEQIVDFQQQIEKLKETIGHLRQQETELQALVANLDHANQEHLLSLQNTQTQLQQAVNNYQATQEQLALKINEFNVSKQQMTAEIAKVKQTNSTLATALDGYQLFDTQQREARRTFQHNMDSLFNRTEQSFNQAAEENTQAREKLQETYEAYQAQGTRWKELLDNKEKQVQLFTTLNEAIKQNQIPEKVAQCLNQIGFYAKGPDERAPDNPILTQGRGLG